MGCYKLTHVFAHWLLLLFISHVSVVTQRLKYWPISENEKGKKEHWINCTYTWFTWHACWAYQCCNQSSVTPVTTLVTPLQVVSRLFGAKIQYPVQKAFTAHRWLKMDSYCRINQVEIWATICIFFLFWQPFSRILDKQYSPNQFRS